MTLAAGIDVGNSTTEVVLARLVRGDVEIVGAGRAPTRRAKGSPESLDGAAALVRRLERQHGVRVAVAAASQLRPVETRTASLPEPRESTGRLRVLKTAASTAGGRGAGVGRPVRLGDDVPGDGPVVAVVPSGTGYRDAAGRLAGLARTGRLAAAVLEDDEAVLVANRLGGAVPVVDEVDAAAVLAAGLVAVEVADAGTALRALTDSLRLIADLGLRPDERGDAARVAARLADSSNAVVAVTGDRPAAAADAAGWVAIGGARVPFPEAHARIADGVAGLAAAYALPPVEAPLAVDDLWTVDLSSIADAVVARRAAAGSRAVGLAALRADTSYADPSAALAERLGVPVHVGSEVRAAWAGGVSTPGASGGVVVDLGGGTIDVVCAGAGAGADVTVAGGGELLRVSVAALTGATAAAAEWVKRGPAHRVEAPQVLLGEDGSRGFLDRAAPPETVGALVVTGPAGLLPFSRVLAPGEWRALRLRLKIEAVGGNVARALRTLDVAPDTVVVVGGPAGDDEVLSAVARALPPGVAVGRGDVGGVLGHRHAVAYGLLARLAR